MIDRNKSWLDKVTEIQKICAAASLPVTPEADNNPHGIDGQLEFGDIDFEKSGDIFEIDWNIILVYKINKKQWSELIVKLMLLSQKLCSDQRFTFDGWTRNDDPTDLIYSGIVIVKGLANSDVLQ